MNAAKIRLSQKEMELINNSDWILTKNGILQKTKQLLENLQVLQQQYLQSHAVYLPEEVYKSLPKISRGENYKGLPYLILDYPRCFDKKNICAIRIMFWWGNFFSCTLHLSGKYKQLFSPKIISSYPLLKEKDFFCCVQENEWEHHFEKTNYLPLFEMSKHDFETAILKNYFVKLAKKISLLQWDDTQEKLLGYFKQNIEMITV